MIKLKNKELSMIKIDMDFVHVIPSLAGAGLVIISQQIIVSVCTGLIIYAITRAISCMGAFAKKKFLAWREKKAT